MLLYLILVSSGMLKVYKFCAECRWFEWPPFLLDLFYGLLHTGLLFLYYQKLDWLYQKHEFLCLFVKQTLQLLENVWLICILLDQRILFIRYLNRCSVALCVVAFLYRIMLSQVPAIRYWIIACQKLEYVYVCLLLVCIEMSYVSLQKVLSQKNENIFIFNCIILVIRRLMIRKMNGTYPVFSYWNSVFSCRKGLFSFSMVIFSCRSILQQIGKSYFQSRELCLLFYFEFLSCLNCQFIGFRYAGLDCCPCCLLVLI